MAKFMKWIGGGLGWAAGGPIGALLGFMFGSFIDGIQLQPVTSDQSSSPVSGRKRNPTRQGDFFASLLLLSAAVMKSDKKVMRSELDYVKQFLSRQFGKAETESHLQFLKAALEQDFDVKEVASQVGYYMDAPAKLQLIHYLFGIALADGQAVASEIEAVNLIANYMGVRPADFESIKAMFIKDMRSAYKILDVSPDASDEEIKKAYRRMALKYHPDRVSHLGDDIQKAAKEKFQELQSAWETVKNERRMA